MKRTVTVLQDDIDQGVRSDSQRCAVARAAGRDLADVMEERGCTGGVSAGYYFLGLLDARNLFRVRLDVPPEVGEFVEAFDGGNPVEPFKFEVEVPE